MMLVLQLFCPLATSFTKLGILVLLHKILASTSRRYSVLIRITFVIVLLTMVTQFIIPLVNCAPFSYNWDRRLPGGTCRIPGLMLWRWVSMPNMFTTVIMILIPLPSLYKLRISHAEKLGLGLVFIVCLLGVLAAVMRFRAFMMVQNFKDITFEMAAPLCWTLAESGIYLIAGVLPTLKPLVKKMVGEEWLERRRMREDESFGYKGSGSGSGNGYKDESRNGSGATEEIALSGIGRSLEFKVSVEDYDEMRTATGGSGGEGDERGLVGKRRAFLYMNA
ncbi:hypothetical protein P154DRAFT_521569 [Amniculicola lignicola CBS 123094]|uniref:Rhodopsin domain-containing protein n=1 Tax=Amniculicola lignicola CBS 123094 TaxID=1392246 RepID=A0A6A5WIU4_9PLEO|nr:hypothetical protein P154DRAFT_521569 [Amniculicola lignicola CBS 123094]